MAALPASGTSQAEATAAIAEQRRAYDQAFNTADIDSIAGLITRDVTFTTAAGRGPAGADELLASLRDMFAERPGLQMIHAPESIELGPDSWAIASERGTWAETWLQNGEPVTLEGIYLTLWRREEGTWKTAAELLIALSCTGTYCSA